MYFSICFLVVLTVASIPCDAQFGGSGGFGKFGGFGGKGELEGMSGFKEMGMGDGGMGGMDMGKKGMGKMGNWAPLIPTDDEREMCEVEASDQGQKLANTFKVVKKTCEVMCQMENGEKSKLMSPEGTMCCDMGGVGPTGKCDGNGGCNMMGMKGMKE